MENVKGYALELIALIEEGKIKTRGQLNEARISLCAKHGLSSMPSNPTILSFAKRKTDKILSLLRVKPTRTLSGIAVVAIMPKPSKCPGKCIYCPGSLVPQKTPKSYTGKEPATMRALASNFSPKTQIKNRLKQLEEAGHNTEKVELIIMGGTFLSQPKSYQRRFMLSSLNAFTGSKSGSLKKARKNAEKSKTRIAGITFETRPDFCGKEEINSMLEFGGTRCELGVQTIYNQVYRKINRGHGIEEVKKATQLLKDSAFKTTYHYMPGLPTVSPAGDRKALKQIFSNPDFMPDNLKIYPCLVIEGTKLYRMWRSKNYKPFSTKKAIKLLSEIKPSIPRWVRIMRIQRDIPSPLISAGVKKSNLRQLVQEEMKKHGKKCSCIRCREAGLFSRKEKLPNSSDAKLFVESYNASKGKEFFISLEGKKRKTLFGFCRLRFPFKPFRKELLGETALVRELRVFGFPMPLHKRKEEGLQHRGFGKRLLAEAENLATEFGSKNLAVISGLGVKPYYYRLGFKEKGLYVSKKL